MTKIRFFKENDKFIKLECSGHTGYGEFGEDVLCASLSGIVGAIEIGITKVLGINAKVIRKDNDGYILIELPRDIDTQKLDSVQILFETMKESIEDLMQGYSQYISMEVIV